GVRRIVGYQHSSVTPRHLAFEQPDAGTASALPDQVITVGAVTAAWLGERAPALAGRVAIGASLRRARDIPAPAEHGLLVAISSSRDEALALLRVLLAAAPGLRLPVIVRSHPTIPAEDLFAGFAWPANVRLSRGTSLADDLAATTLVAYSSSTVALEGMLGGRLPVFVDIGDVPPADPLIGNCPAKLSTSSAAELVAAVALVQSLGAAQLEARRDAARRYAESYLREPDREAMAEIVEAIAGPPQRAPLRLSAVIPTKNRAEDLERAVASILAQSRPPDELLIVDQSAGEEPRRRVGALARRTGKPALVYVHDPSISGLVHAKQVAARKATGDIVCFLEDDEVLEPDYFHAIEQGFHAHPAMLGCSGLVTNLPPLPAGYVRLFHLFHRGIFRDARVGVHGHVRGADLALIPSDCLSGGLSCWRRAVLEAVPFDVANGFHMLEDIDFSTRAAARFGARFFINPNARLEHRMSPVNRDVLGARQRRKLREFVIFYKKRSAQPGAGLQLGWLLVGLVLEAATQCVRARSLSPLGGYFMGIADGARWKLRDEAA
ncbi:MAG: glycosyltransferase, partial [Pseudomonadota bacterium]